MKTPGILGVKTAIGYNMKVFGLGFFGFFFLGFFFPFGGIYKFLSALGTVVVLI